LIRRFETRIAITAIGSSCCAIPVARLFLGQSPDFKVEAVTYSGFGSGFLFLALGVAAGILGAAYSGALLGTISLADRLRWPIELRAAVIGGVVGAIAWFAPAVVRGGHFITQCALSGAATARCSRESQKAKAQLTFAAVVRHKHSYTIRTETS